VVRLQYGAGARAELVGQPAAQRLVGEQRLARVAEPFEHLHPQAARAFAERAQLDQQQARPVGRRELVTTDPQGCIRVALASAG